MLAGNWKPEGVWGGMKDGMIRLAPLNPAIPADVQTLVRDLEARIKAGSFHPFTGPLADQAGKERLAAGMVMDDAALGKMDYFVQGVSSRLPTAR